MTDAATTPRTAHQYLHDEAVWPDEDEAWHERVCENLRYIETAAPTPARKPGCIYQHPHPDHECRNQDDMAAAPTLADLPRTRGDGTVAYEPSDEPAAPLNVERLALSIVALPESWDMDLRTEEAVKQYAARIATEYNRRAERREALRKLSQDASDLGIYDEPQPKSIEEMAAAPTTAEHCCPPHSEKDCQYDCDGMCPCC